METKPDNKIGVDEVLEAIVNAKQVMTEEEILKSLIELGYEEARARELIDRALGLPFES